MQLTKLLPELKELAHKALLKVSRKSTAHLAVKPLNKMIAIINLALKEIDKERINGKSKDTQKDS